jgi:hypothetical protein
MGDGVGVVSIVIAIAHPGFAGQVAGDSTISIAFGVVAIAAVSTYRLVARPVRFPKPDRSYSNHKFIKAKHYSEW